MIPPANVWCVRYEIRDPAGRVGVYQWITRIIVAPTAQSACNRAWAYIRAHGHHVEAGVSVRPMGDV